MSEDLPFKQAFKYFKSKCPPPDLKKAINLKGSQEKVSRRLPVATSDIIDKHLVRLGLVPSSEWNIFELTNHPGLIVVQNPFTIKGSHLWIRKCLSEYPGPPNKSNLHNHGLLDPEENWWNICQMDPTRKDILSTKLRWITLGYHHDWDSKVYSESNKSDFPDELKELGFWISKAVGGWEVTPQAAILNFYQMDSTLSGHTDHSEPNNTAPLISISFGQSAVFLIGGKELHDPTSALIINNGDVLIMSGESRLCYHGVAKILRASSWEASDQYLSFLEEARINLNMRQVLSPGQLSL